MHAVRQFYVATSNDTYTFVFADVIMEESEIDYFTSDVDVDFLDDCGYENSVDA